MDKVTISLDPTRCIPADLAFVSHAHTDHLSKTYFKSGVNKVLTSKETMDIALARGFSIGRMHKEDNTVQLLNTGHILGSRGLLVDHELFYTGDISIRKRAFMSAEQVPHVKTLIIESTFGRPHYIFPAVSEIVHKTNEIISQMYDRGIPVLLMGYPLGKAQLLAYLFQHWEPFYTYDSVASMNLIYRKYGVPLKDSMVFSEASEKGLLAKSKPWVMVCPVMHSGSTFVKFMKQKFGAVSVGFSGWAIDPRYRAAMGFDYALPLSDHCDYSELLEVVNLSGAEKIYTFHGFAAEFAISLEKLGFKAEALKSYPKRGRVRHRKPGVNRIDSYF
jgi:putative mRNA 3-end processing factor